MNAIRDILRLSKKALKEHHGRKLADVILFGSFARDEATAESDIDLLVVLEGDFDHFSEMKAIIDILYPLQLDSPYLISAKPALKAHFEKGLIQLYRNAKREGVAV
jgi:predicted nucleotidyltransferase